MNWQPIAAWITTICLALMVGGFFKLTNIDANHSWSYALIPLFILGILLDFRFIQDWNGRYK